jgi:hypothetical protein
MQAEKSMRWTYDDKDKLRRKSIQVDESHWIYETPQGYEMYCGHKPIFNKCIGFIPIQTIKAYVKRWDAIRKGSWV